MVTYIPDYSPEEELQLETELRQWITDYQAAAASLHDFRVWLLGRSWKLHRDNHTLIGLYGLTQDRLIRFASGPWTEDDLRQSLAFVVAAVDNQPVETDPLYDDSRPMRTTWEMPTGRGHDEA